jgi:glycosyltransferase involved in cell wall biosynthesis
LADKYANFFVVKIISLMKNSGAGSARNRGWDAAGQPYIAFLDADDAWHPKKIEIQYGWMLDHPEYGLVGHGHVIQRGGENSWPTLRSNFCARSVTKISALFSNPFATRTVMLKRDLPFRFKDGKRYAEDYLLWLQIIQSVPSAYLDVPLASSYKDEYGSEGLSSRLWKMEAGVLDTYWVLHKEGAITLFLASCLSIYSLAKYVRRVGIVLGRRLIRCFA